MLRLFAGPLQGINFTQNAYCFDPLYKTHVLKFAQPQKIYTELNRQIFSARKFM